MSRSGRETGPRRTPAQLQDEAKRLVERLSADRVLPEEQVAIYGAALGRVLLQLPAGRRRCAVAGLILGLGDIGIDFGPDGPIIRNDA